MVRISRVKAMVNVSCPRPKVGLATCLQASPVQTIPAWRRALLSCREWQGHDLRLAKICIGDTTRQP